MKFVLENKDILFDFQYELYRQKEYYDWLNKGKSKELQTQMIVCTEKELKAVDPYANRYHWCPVGSVEFCVNWYKKLGKTPLPKNVPDELIKLCSRKIINMETSDECIKRIPSPKGWMFDELVYFPTISTDNIFRKDTKTIKSRWNGVVKKDDDLRFHDGDHKYHNHFQVSEVMDDIVSEWRCFIYNGELVDLKCYSGDPFSIPSKEYIEQCIKEYKSAPVAYTLDICTRENHPNEIIEVHDFFSCGLYGFNDPKYPIMLWRWYEEYITK